MRPDPCGRNRTSVDPLKWLRALVHSVINQYRVPQQRFRGALGMIPAIDLKSRVRFMPSCHYPVETANPGALGVNEELVSYRISQFMQISTVDTCKDRIERWAEWWATKPQKKKALETQGLILLAGGDAGIRTLDSVFDRMLP